MNHTDSIRQRKTHSSEPDAESSQEGMPSTLPEGGLEKSVTIERQGPRPGKAVEESIGAKMPDRK
jgi:hypothetical protein